MFTTANASVLFGFSTRNQTLYHIDPEQSTTTAIGQAGLPPILSGDAGLAYDLNTRTAYGVFNGDNTIYSVDLETGLWNPLFNYLLPFTGSLAFNSNEGLLYAMGGSRQLFSINPQSGEIVDNVALGLTLEGLAYVTSTNTLFGYAASVRRLTIVDLMAGTNTLLPSTIGIDISNVGLAYDPDQDILLGAGQTGFGDHRFFTLDQTNGNNLGPQFRLAPDANVTGLLFASIPEPSAPLILACFGLFGFFTRHRSKL